MARIAGVDIPRDKRVVIALTYVYGIGPTRARKALEATEIDENLRVRELDENQVAALRSFVEESYQLEGDLRREVANNIKRKIEIGSYQGVRHRLGLPVRGQRTHTNARTRKGPKRGAATVRKPVRKG